MANFLRKISMTFYKNTSGSDSSQIPASGASVQVYRQGATITSTISVTTSPAGVAIPVSDSSTLTFSDLGFINTSSVSEALALVSVDSATQIHAKSTTGSSFTVNTGDRIVLTTSPPTIYSDVRGTLSITNPITIPSTGLVEFYTSNDNVDLFVTGTGVTTALYADVGGWIFGSDVAVSINLSSGKVFKINGTQVVGPQGAAVGTASGTASGSDVTAKFNTLIARLQAHGLIA